jgi:hypothetical protein
VKGNSKKEVSETLKYLIKTADGSTNIASYMLTILGGPKLFLSIRDVVSHVATLLEDDGYYPIFGPDYSSILLDHITPVTGYCHLISRQAYNGIRSIFLFLI